MKKCFYLLLSLWFISVGAFGVDYQGNPERQALICQFFNTIMKKKNLGDNTPSFSCRKKTLNGMIFVDLEAKNFIPNSRYNLFRLNASFKKTFLGSFIANKEGELIEENNEGALKPERHISYYRFISNGIIPGEAISFILYPKDSQNGQAPLFTTYIESPLEYKWKDNAKVSVHVMDVFTCLILGYGFKPNEEVIWTAENCGEMISSEAVTNDEGLFSSLFIPGDNYELGGAENLTIYRKSTRELGSVIYYWGKEGIKHSKQYQKQKKSRCSY